MSADTAFNKKNIQTAIFLLFLILLLIQSWFYDWESDEAWSYVAIQTNNFFEIISYSKFKFANNHLINSLYFKILQWLDVKNVFFYRLLSIGGFILYFYGTSKILEALKTKHFLILLLLLTPYFIFFTLGRGYGFAMGSFAMSLYFLIQYLNRPNIKSEYFLIFFGVLSSISVLSFLYSFISVVAIYFIFKIRHRIDVHFFILGFIALITTAYVYHTGKIINEYDPNIAGSNSFFKNGVLSSILSDFSYFTKFKDYRYFNLIRLLISLCLVSPVLYYFFFNLKKIIVSFETLKKPQTAIVVCIGLSFLFMIVANLLFHAKFPMGRAIMNIQYLLLLMVAWIIANKFPHRIWSYIPILILSIVSLIRITDMCYNLSFPGFKTVILKTGNDPLYAFGIFTNVLLVNQFEDIRKKNIYPFYGVNLLRNSIQNDTAHTIYILSHTIYKDSLPDRIHKVYDCRDGLALYKLNR